MFSCLKSQVHDKSNALRMPDPVAVRRNYRRVWIFFHVNKACVFSGFLRCSWVLFRCLVRLFYPCHP
jgi:hypothetical protein